MSSVEETSRNQTADLSDDLYRGVINLLRMCRATFAKPNALPPHGVVADPSQLSARDLLDEFPHLGAILSLRKRLFRDGSRLLWRAPAPTALVTLALPDVGEAFTGRGEPLNCSELVEVVGERRSPVLPLGVMADVLRRTLGFVHFSHDSFELPFKELSRRRRSDGERAAARPAVGVNFFATRLGGRHGVVVSQWDYDSLWGRKVRPYDPRFTPSYYEFLGDMIPPNRFVISVSISHQAMVFHVGLHFFAKHGMCLAG